VQIANDVPSSATPQLVSYNAKGLVTGGQRIGPNDLPPATQSARGAVFPGPSLAVSVAGEIDHKNVISPGTATKVSYDRHGHITTATTLSPIDIPNISAAKLTSGKLDPLRITDRSITQEMLADYAIAYIQESIPISVNVHHNGMLWLQESTGQMRMWNGNSWFPIGFGRLSQENLRYCGVFNAATGLITGLTQFGGAEPFSIGDPIPAATDKRSGVYFVAETAGSGTTAAAGVTFDPGDWILCNGATAGWVRIDTLNSGGGGTSSGGGGGGGGTGAQRLDDLLDVQISPGLAADDILQYTAAGQWVSRSIGSSLPLASTTVKGILRLASQAEVDGGTEATKAITAATLKQAIISQAGAAITGVTAPVNPVDGQLWTDTSKSPPAVNIWDGTNWIGVTPPDASTTVKGIVQLATQADVDAGADALKVLTPQTLQNCLIDGGSY